MKVITVVHTNMKRLGNLKCKAFLTGSISSSVLCSMVEAIPGRLKTSVSRSLLWNDRLLHRGLPRLVPVFLGMGPLLLVIPFYGRGLLC